MRGIVKMTILGVLMVLAAYIVSDWVFDSLAFWQHSTTHASFSLGGGILATLGTLLLASMLVIGAISLMVFILLCVAMGVMFALLSVFWPIAVIVLIIWFFASQNRKKASIS